MSSISLISEPLVIVCSSTSSRLLFWESSLFIVENLEVSDYYIKSNDSSSLSMESLDSMRCLGDDSLGGDRERERFW